MPLGSESSPDSTVAPVVVIPDIASKNASVNPDSVLPRTKGSAPKSGRTVHMPVVMTNAC